MTNRFVVGFESELAEEQFMKMVQENYPDVVVTSRTERSMQVPEKYVPPPPLLDVSFEDYADGPIQVPYFKMTSGTLFARKGNGWTGPPDATTNSAVFRMVTVRRDFLNVAVGLELNTLRMVSSAKLPSVAWDGVHIFLRYQSEFHLYYASVNRRDGKCVIKKKVPNGLSNGGTYHEVGHTALYPWVPTVLQKVRAVAMNLYDGTVGIDLSVDDKLILSVVDDGVGGAPPILVAGGTGIRGDNTEFMFNKFKVENIPGGK